MHDAVTPTVVVVDDDPDTLEFVCALLDDMGVVPVGISETSRALVTIARIQPRAIILDVDMPGIDGIELFESLRADSQTRAIAVIFFTASGQALRKRLIEYKAQGATLVAKPDIALLHRTVQDTLEAAEAAYQRATLNDIPRQCA